MNSVRLGEIVAALGGELRGDPAHEIARIAPLESAGGDAITFVAQARLQKALEASLAGAIVVAPALVAAAPAGRSLVVTDDPYLYFARLTQWWAKRLRPARIRPPGSRPAPSSRPAPASGRTRSWRRAPSSANGCSSARTASSAP